MWRTKNGKIKQNKVVLVRVSIPAQTSWPRSKLRRKGFIRLTLPYCCSSPRKSGLELKQVKKQELMQRPWRDVLYRLASPGLLSLLSYRTKTTSPEMALPTRWPLPLITNWENALQLCPVQQNLVIPWVEKDEACKRNGRRKGSKTKQRVVKVCLMEA